MLKGIIKNRFTEWLRNLSFLLWVKWKYGNKVSFQNSTCRVHPKAIFEGRNKLFYNSAFTGTFMGYGTYISHDSDIGGCIGRFCCIAPNVKYNLGIHPFTSPYVTVSPMFYSTSKQSGKAFYINKIL